jgi:hypothetical protein
VTHLVVVLMTKVLIMSWLGCGRGKGGGVDSGGGGWGGYNDGTDILIVIHVLQFRYSLMPTCTKVIPLFIIVFDCTQLMRYTQQYYFQQFLGNKV